MSSTSQFPSGGPDADLLSGELASNHLAEATDTVFWSTEPGAAAPQTCADCGRENTGSGGGEGPSEPQTCADCGREKTGS